MSDVLIAQEVGTVVAIETAPAEIVEVVAVGPQGQRGEKGDSAYAAAVANGFVGTEAQWLTTLVGPQGPQGIQGVQGPQGAPGVGGVDGRGIVSMVRTNGTGVPGTTDTYTITYSDATTSTFQVYNGADGNGTGDMLATTYDTNADGKVNSADSADAVPWSGVTGKPASFPPDAHTHAQYVDSADPRLSDARPASDVSAWAKAATKPSYTKADVGLGNVDNTSDANKPVSTATQAALDTKAPLSHVGATGAAHGVVTTSVAGFMSAADKSKLDGVAANANNYSHPTGDGNLHVPATGTTNNGKVLKAGATAGSLSWGTLAKADVGLGNVDNTSDANKPISTAMQTALDGKQVAGSYAAATHTHTVADVSGLQAALDGKQAAGSYATLAGAESLSNKTLSAPISTGAIYDNGSVRGKIVAVAALAIDCSLGNYFTKTISGASTFTFTNVPASGNAYAFTLELTHTSGTVTWPTSVKWPGDTAPTLTTAKTHLFTFVTDDGGARWRGVANVNYTN